MKRFFSLLLIFFAALGVGQELDRDCCLEVSGEWLYMLSAIDQPYYYFTIDPNEAALGNLVGDRIANTQEWHSGYRIEAAYHLNCLDTIRARWTHFPNFSDKSQTDGLGFPVFSALFAQVPGSILRAAIRDEFNVYTLDILYEREFYTLCPFFLTFQAGVQLGRIDMSENFEYTSSTDLLVGENQSKVRGVGPEIGIDMCYASLFNCLDIKGRALAALWISEKQAKLRQLRFPSDPNLIGSTENDEYWLTTPSLDIRFGLAYHRSLACWCFCGAINIEAGYEFIHFVNGVNRIFFVFAETNGSAASTTQQMDLTLHGPYVHIGFCF